MTEFDYFGKVTIVGCSGVGKTSMCQRFLGRAIDGVETTLAAAFIVYNRVIEDKKIQVEVWDTVSNERFIRHMETYHRGSCMSLLVYDITERSSFTRLDEWAKIVLGVIPNDLSIFVIGNKMDLENERKVSTREAENYARKQNYTYLEISALTGHNISKLLDDIAKRIYRIATGEIHMDSNSPVFKSIVGSYSMSSNPNQPKDLEEEDNCKKCCKKCLIL